MFARILVTFTFLFGLSILTTHAQQQAKLMLPIGHTLWIDAATFSPNGKWIATADVGTIIIWESLSGKSVLFLDGFDGVNSIQFSPDSKSILVSSLGNQNRNHLIRIFDIELGTLVRTFEDAFDAKFDFNGKRIVAISSDRSVKIWDLPTGNMLFKLTGHEEHINSFSLSKDGKLLATSSEDRIIIWNLDSGVLQQELKTNDELESLEFSPNKNLLLTKPKKGSASIWNYETGTLAWNLFRRDQIFRLDESAEFSPTGRMVVTSSKDQGIKIWSTENGELLKDIVGSAQMAKFSLDESQLITINYDTIQIWDTKTGSLLRNLSGHHSIIRTAELSPNKKLIITSSMDKTTKVWDLKTCKILHTLSGHTSTEENAKFNPKGEQVVTQTSQDVCKIINVNNGKPLLHFNKVNTMNFSPDGNQIAFGCSDNSIKVWDFAKSSLIMKADEHAGQIRSIMFSPDSKRLVSASTDETAKIWDIHSGRSIHNLVGHTSGVSSAQFSPTGAQVVTAAEDNTIKMWDANSGKIIWELSKNDSYVRSDVFSPKFSPAGTILVTSRHNEPIKIWETKTGKLVWNFSLLYHNDPIYAAEFSPDGKELVTLSRSSIIWDLTNGRKKIEMVPYSSFHFSQDGNDILTTSNNIAAIWANGTEVNLLGHTEAINSAEFSPNKELVVTASDDTSIKLWNAKNGKLFYTFIGVDSIDYLIYDEHYRYDGTENARKLLYLTCGTEVIELDQVKDQLWVPNLAERIMKGEEINSPKLSDLDLCDLIPTVEELEHGKDGAYQFRITPRRGGLGQTVVFVNGIEVKRLEVNQLVPSGNDYLLVLPVSEVESFFVAGQPNNVSVRAFTKNNDIGSRGATVETVSEKKSDPPALHAVVVGVSDYKGDPLDLKYAAKDARDFSNALNTAAGKLFNFDGTNRIHLYPIHTEADRKFFPDKKSIQSVFESIGKQAQPNDVLLIFFAGHGVMNPADQQFYFLTADASAMANPEGAGISTKELFEWIQPSRIKAQKRVLILDACNSGQAINDIVKLGDANQGYTGARSDEQGKFIKAIDKLNERSGLFILSAAASDQSAYEMGRYNQGVLTYALLKSAKEDPSVLEGRQFLNLGQWFDVAQRLVEDIAASSGARQQPQVVRTTNFNIGVVDEEVRKKIVLAKEKPVFSNCIFQDEVVPVDKLNLNKLLDKELSDLASRNADNFIVFYPGSTSTEAYQLTGRYTVSGTTVTLNVFLLHRGEVMKTTQLKGDTKELAKLAGEVLGWATNVMR